MLEHRLIRVEPFDHEVLCLTFEGGQEHWLVHHNDIVNAMAGVMFPISYALIEEMIHYAHLNAEIEQRNAQLQSAKNFILNYMSQAQITDLTAINSIRFVWQSQLPAPTPRSRKEPAEKAASFMTISRHKKTPTTYVKSEEIRLWIAWVGKEAPVNVPVMFNAKHLQEALLRSQFIERAGTLHVVVPDEADYCFKDLLSIRQEIATLESEKKMSRQKLEELRTWLGLALDHLKSYGMLICGFYVPNEKGSGYYCAALFHHPERLITTSGSEFWVMRFREPRQ